MASPRFAVYSCPGFGRAGGVSPLILRAIRGLTPPARRLRSSARQTALDAQQQRRSGRRGAVTAPGAVPPARGPPPGAAPGSPPPASGPPAPAPPCSTPAAAASRAPDRSGRQCNALEITPADLAAAVG